MKTRFKTIVLMAMLVLNKFIQKFSTSNRVVGVSLIAYRARKVNLVLGLVITLKDRRGLVKMVIHVLTGRYQLLDRQILQIPTMSQSVHKVVIAKMDLSHFVEFQHIKTKTLSHRVGIVQRESFVIPLGL